MMAEIAATTADTAFIFVNQGEGLATIEHYLEAENLELDHIVLDSRGEFGRHYDALGLPTTLFIGSDGQLRSVHMGEISREGLLTGIDRLRSEL
jgi:hypothetical protein